MKAHISKYYNYDKLAKNYESVSHKFSNGKIKESKLAQIKHMNYGKKVLYVGCGACEDAIEAAKKGMQVTCIDISTSMIEIAKKKFSEEGIHANFITEDILSHSLLENYDFITANYFLNIIKKENLAEILQHLNTLLKENGMLFIADFAIPNGNVLFRILPFLYHFIANSFAWIDRLAPLHNIYNYTCFLEKENFKYTEIEYFKLFHRGPKCYQNIVAYKSPITSSS